MTLKAWAVLIVVLACMLYFLALALLATKPKGAPKHRAARKHRPSGDLLRDWSRDDELDGPTLPPRTLEPPKHDDVGTFELDGPMRLNRTAARRFVSIDGVQRRMPRVVWDSDVAPLEVPPEVVDRIAERTVAEAKGVES